MEALEPIWAYIDIPYEMLLNMTGFPAPPILDWGWRILALGVLFVFAWRLGDFLLTMFRGTLQGKKLGPAPAPEAALGPPGMEVSGEDISVAAMPAGESIDARVARLKAAKDWNAIGETYAADGRYGEALKWFKKGKNKRRAAIMIAKKGNPLKAARLLLKEGDYLTAAKYFDEKGRALDAAKAYEQGGDYASAARAFERAKKFQEALHAYKKYFETTRDNEDAQVKRAEAVAALLQVDDVKKLDMSERVPLYGLAAQRFLAVKRADTAAELYEAAGDLPRAAKAHLDAGQLKRAAECYTAAGQDKEAAQVTGRFHASQGQWREAAMAYAAAGEYAMAGDCYGKANDPVNAAECFEKAQSWYRSGVGYAHSRKFSEAISVLQKVPEDDPNYDASRALLGRCFFEDQKYYDVIAVLDNHLLGKRVDSRTKDYFYMLALAYENTNQNEKCRDLLRKINAVDTNYKDVNKRIQTLSSRISMNSQAQTGGDGAATAPSTTPSAIGTRYQILDELGRGGMGVVYKASDTQLKRPVALKVVNKALSDSDEFRQRFLREAQAAARITHPNIVGVYDACANPNEQAYIAMEYVEGMSLGSLIHKKGRLKPLDAIALAGQACAALAAIHEAGIIHRDVKPDNILIAKGGNVKLTDFGLARGEDSRLTRTGTSMGTPAYMSPEQVLGKEADARSDLYSLGLVMHHALTGSIYFYDGDVLERQLNEMPVLPSQTTEGIPESLDAIVMKCVQKKAGDRYSSARALLADLKQARTALAEA